MSGDHSPDWREEAIHKALARTEEGDGFSVLLSEIRRHRPGAVVKIIRLERAEVLRFLGALPGGLHSLTGGLVEVHSRNGAVSAGESPGRSQADEDYPFLGWYEAEWRGARFEVVLPPGYASSHVSLCVGDTRTDLNAFVGALNDAALRPSGHCLQYSAGWKSAPDLDAELGKVTWDDIVLPAPVMADLRDAVEGFFANQAMFTSLGFAWRRGVLLVGPPGTGKTMVCKAAAAALPDLPFLYVRDLRSNRVQEPVRAIFERARRLAPCLLAFEDVDGFVNEANRTLFLNELDGFQNNDGLLIIASSNHPGKIDEALLKRPSRFDRVFHLGLPELAERREYCRRVLSRSALAERLDPVLDTDALAQQVAERTDGFTPAYLKEVFVSAALQQAQQGATRLDARFAAAALSQVDELRRHLQRLRDPEALAEIPTGALPIGLRR